MKEEIKNKPQHKHTYPSSKMENNGEASALGKVHKLYYYWHKKNIKVFCI